MTNIDFQLRALEAEARREREEMVRTAEKFVQAVERGERTDVPERAVELAGFIAESWQRQGAILDEYMGERTWIEQGYSGGVDCEDCGRAAERDQPCSYCGGRTDWYAYLFKHVYGSEERRKNIEAFRYFGNSQKADELEKRIAAWENDPPKVIERPSMEEVQERIRAKWDAEELAMLEAAEELAEMMERA